MAGILVFLCAASVLLAQEDYTRDEYQFRQKYKIANAFYEKGKENFLKGKDDKAEEELKKALETLPEHADASFFMAQIASKKGNFEEALEYITTAKENYKFIMKMKMNTEQQYMLQLQEQRQKAQEYILQLKEALSHTTDVQEQEQLRNSISKKESEISIIDGRLRKPVPEMKEAEAIPADYSYIHGNILFKMKKYEDAFKQYEETIRLNPSHGNAYNNLANLYYMAKQYQKSLDYLNMAEEHGATVNPKFREAVRKALAK